MQKDDTIHLGAFSKMQPAVNFANYHEVSATTVWGPRTIPDFQFIYVVKGNPMLEMGDYQRELTTGDCIFLGPESPHLFSAGGQTPLSILSLHFDWNRDSPEPIHPVEGIRTCTSADLSKRINSYVIDLSGVGDVMIPHYVVIPELEGSLRQIVEEYQSERPEYEVALRGLLMHLLIAFLRSNIYGYDPSSATQKKIAPVLEAIRKKPEKAWTTIEMAALTGYHATYFAAIFKKVVGHSPKHYVVLERIRHAKMLLMQGNKIETISRQLGYTSVHYFCRNFKQMTGFTPSEYRRRNVEL